MSVQFQPQVWGDKIFSPITNAIQQERQRQHQKSLADARNNLQQQNINMQKEAIGRALDQQKGMSDIFKQVWDRSKVDRKFSKDYQKEQLRLGTEEGKKEAVYGKPGEGSLFDMVNLKKAFDYLTFDSDDVKSKALKNIGGLPEYAPLHTQAGVWSPEYYNLIQSSESLSNMGIDELINAAGAK